jgi:hypothetical protein
MPKKVPEPDDVFMKLDLDQLEKTVDDLKDKLRERKINRNFVQQERVNFI